MNDLELRSEMMDFLPRYEYAEGKNYEPTNYGVDEIIRQWRRQKGWLISAFEKHPNYNGRYQIVLNETFGRKVDEGAIRLFRDWVYRNIRIQDPDRAYVMEPRDRDNYPCGWCRPGMDDYVGKTVDVYLSDSSRVQLMMFDRSGHRDIWCFHPNHLLFLYDTNCFYAREGRVAFGRWALIANLLREHNQYLNDNDVDWVNREFPKLRIHRNAKLSRVMRRIMVEIGLDKLPDFNARFTAFADAINPLDVTRWTIFSLHPIDYWAMSFGNSWTSCHSIDKTDQLGVYSGSYHGCYSGGTESYMLDPSSIVCYVVDRSFTGERFELDPKIMRQMFHVRYDGTQFVQGRLSPQDNDSGSKELYDKLRATFQRVISECFGNVNDWTVKRGTSACDSIIATEGDHYPDYQHFDNCNVSTLRDFEPDGSLITVGAEQICPHCGEWFRDEECILCDDCRKECTYTCDWCGCDIPDDSDDAVTTLDGHHYCDYGCAENDGYVCCSDDEWRHSDDEDVFYDSYWDRYFYDPYGNRIETVDDRYYEDEYAAERDGYVYCVDTEDWRKKDDCIFDEERYEWKAGE